MLVTDTKRFTVRNVLVGQRAVDPATENVTASYFFHTDRLGSICVITDQNGPVVQRLSYDVWGKSRVPTSLGDAVAAKGRFIR